MQYRVKVNAVLIYGTTNKAKIVLNTGQIWEYVAKSLAHNKFHALVRQNVDIQIPEEDFVRIFEPQESEE